VKKHEGGGSPSHTITHTNIQDHKYKLLQCTIVTKFGLRITPDGFRFNLRAKKFENIVVEPAPTPPSGI